MPKEGDEMYIDVDQCDQLAEVAEEFLFQSMQCILGGHTLVGLGELVWYFPVLGSTVQLPRNLLRVLAGFWYRRHLVGSEAYSMSGQVNGSDYHVTWSLTIIR